MLKTYERKSNLCCRLLLGGGGLLYENTGGTKNTLGYIGGRTEHPSYEQVCSGETGHKEAVEVIFDTEKTSYEKLLKVFWSMHDPTTETNRKRHW